jgi:hypothetical protein
LQPAPGPELIELRAVIERELQSGAPREVTLARLQEAGQDRLDGLLGDVYAETLMSQGRADELIEQARTLTGTFRNDPGPDLRKARVAMLCTYAAALEGKNMIAMAARAWRAAGILSGWRSADPYLALTAEIGSLRCMRKRRLGWLFHPLVFYGQSPKFAALLRQAEELQDLRQRPVTARECVAEVVGPLHATGNRKGRLWELLVWLEERGEAFPSVSIEPERLRHVSEALFGETVMSANELVSRTVRLAYDPSQSPKLAKALRDEVDWTLVRAANREPAPAPA